MKYTLLINGGPDSSSAETALAFAEALLSSGHSLYRLFFYQAGVLLARHSPDSTDNPVPQRWHQLINRHGVDAVVCISAALRRGLVSEQESRQSEPQFAQVAAGFQVSGLGQFADAVANSHRVVTFG